jgi:hypothetical protein
MTALTFYGKSVNFHKLYDNRKTPYSGQTVYRHETRNFFLDVEYIEIQLSLREYSFKQWPHYIVVLKPKDLSLRARRILKVPFDLNMGWGNDNEIFSRPMAIRADTNDNLLFIRKMDSTHVIPLKHYEVMIDVNLGNNKDSNSPETPAKLQQSRLLLATANIVKLTVHLASKHSGIPINYKKSALAGARHRKLAEIHPPKTKAPTSSLSLVARDVIKNKSTYLTKFKFTYVPDINKWDPQCGAKDLAGTNVARGAQFSVNLHDLCQGAMIELNRRDIKNDPLVTINFFEHMTYNVVAPKETNFIFAFSTYDLNSLSNSTMIASSNTNNVYYMEKPQDGGDKYKKSEEWVDFRKIDWIDRVSYRKLKIGISQIMYDYDLKTQLLNQSHDTMNLC